MWAKYNQELRKEVGTVWFRLCGVHLKGMRIARRATPRPNIHSRELTWKLKKGPIKITVPLKGDYMGFHVSLGECIFESCPVDALLGFCHVTLPRFGVQAEGKRVLSSDMPTEHCFSTVIPFASCALLRTLNPEALKPYSSNPQSF